MAPHPNLDLPGLEASLDARYRKRDESSLQKWLPTVIQIAMMLLALGVLYGRLDGRFALIEYRLGQVELKVSKP